MTNPTTGIGAAVERIEDDRLLRGGGRYLDDLELPGLVHAAFVRSEHAHARVLGVDATAARQLSGVAAVFTTDDFPQASRGKRMPQTAPIPALTAAVSTMHALATDEVCFVGEPVAIVVAASRAIAEDAAALVAVSYEVLPAVTDPRRALAADAPRVRAAAPDNRAGRFAAKFGDIEAAFAGAARVIDLEVESHRGGGHSMEGRGAIAAVEAYSGKVTLWTSTQLPHTVRRHLAAHLGLEEPQVRVVAPDVGGGFGPKGIFYAEELALVLAARALGRPVKWVEDRREHFLASVQQRDQAWTLQVAVDPDGAVRGVRARGTNDCGAYLLYGLLLPLTTVVQFPGPYRWGALELELDCVFTNLTPTSPVRGAGRPYANFVIERAMDAVARTLGLDRAAVRARNMIPDDAYPYETGMRTPAGVPIKYDSGSSRACLDRLLEDAGWAGFGERQRAARESGRYIGLGLACYVEDGGIPPFEGATVRVLPSGTVLVRSGAASQGQGHATIFAQIVCEVLGVPLAQVMTEAADTDAIPRGVGTLGSRIAVTAGSSVAKAAEAVRDKAIAFAAAHVGVAAEGLEIVEGAVVVRGAPARRMKLAEIAAFLNGSAGVPIRPGFEPGLEATAFFPVPAPTYSNGSVAVEVEVDAATGAVRVAECWFVHDCGRMLNPLLVEGQLVGGIVHGLGNALLERMVFDREGQPLSTNYGEYLLPGATDVPRFHLRHIETASTRNPLGVKGVGESGTIPTPAAVISAVEDALSVHGAVFDRHPLSPEDVLAATGCLQDPGKAVRPDERRREASTALHPETAR